MKTLRQGDDSKIAVQVVQDPAVDFSTATEIVVALYIGTTLQYRYKLVEEAGFGICEVDGTDKDTINVFVQRAHSVDFSTGTVRAYVLAAFANPEFPEGSEVKSYEVICARVITGRALDEEIPTV